MSISIIFSDWDADVRVEIIDKLKLCFANGKTSLLDFSSLF